MDKNQIKDYILKYKKYINNYNIILIIYINFLY